MAKFMKRCIKNLEVVRVGLFNSHTSRYVKSVCLVSEEVETKFGMETHGIVIEVTHLSCLYMYREIKDLTLVGL